MDTVYIRKINELNDKLDLIINNQKIIIDTLWNLPMDYSNVNLYDEDYEEFYDDIFGK